MLNSRLLASIRQLPGLGENSRLTVLQCSSPSATGAIIFHVYSESDAQVRAIVKTPRDPASSQCIDAEWEILSGLCREGRYSGLLPAPLAHFDIDGATFHAYRGLPGKTLFSQYRNRIFESRTGMLLRFGRQALAASREIHAAPTRRGNGDALAADLAHSLEALQGLVPGLDAGVCAQAEQAGRVLRASGCELPFGRIHGDFSAYNILTDGRGAEARVGVIDWEHSEPDRPQYLDALRFIASFELMGRRFREGASALQRMRDPANPLFKGFWLPWLAQAGVPACSVDVYRALWMHFFVSAACREQSREKDTARTDKTTYLPGLVELAHC